MSFVPYVLLPVSVIEVVNGDGRYAVRVAGMHMGDVVKHDSHGFLWARTTHARTECDRLSLDSIDRGVHAYLGTSVAQRDEFFRTLRSGR
jgi:hypothetical protein